MHRLRFVVHKIISRFLYEPRLLSHLLPSPSTNMVDVGSLVRPPTAVWRRRAVERVECDTIFLQNYLSPIRRDIRYLENINLTPRELLTERPRADRDASNSHQPFTRPCPLVCPRNNFSAKQDRDYLLAPVPPLQEPVTPATRHVYIRPFTLHPPPPSLRWTYEHLFFLAAAPRADELDLARARVDLPLLDLPQLFLAHGLHLVRLRYLQHQKTQNHEPGGERARVGCMRHGRPPRAGKAQTARVPSVVGENKRGIYAHSRGVARRKSPSHSDVRKCGDCDGKGTEGGREKPAVYV